MKLFYLLTFILLGCPLLHAQAWKGEINEDLPALKKKAEAGDAAAKAEYAFHSLRCMGGLKFQPDLIFTYFTESAEKGHSDGKVGLAHCYCFNVGTIRNVKKAAKLIEEPFKANHPVAQKIMAYLHYGHHGVKARNLQKVRKFNTMSAKQGCIAALYNLGVELNRAGPEQDLKKGGQIFRDLHEKQLFPMASSELFKLMLSHEIWDDQKELFRECLARVKVYAELQEPTALYSIAKFYHQAGDLETAIGYYTQSAHFGSASAWYELWRQNYYGKNPRDPGIVWTHDQTRGNLALRAYLRGVYSNESLSDASWQITRLSWKKDYQAMFPRLEKNLREKLTRFCSHHDSLGRVYLRAEKKTHPQLAKIEWGLNHFIAHSHHQGDAVAELARYYFFKGKPTAQNLAKGYASAILARKNNDAFWHRKDLWEKALKKMTPEAKKLGEALIKDEWPNGEKHRRKAENFLIKIGHLPPRK